MADDDDGSDGEEERGERSTLRTRSKTGPGGLPHSSEAKAFLARGSWASRVRTLIGPVVRCLVGQMADGCTWHRCICSLSTLLRLSSALAHTLAWVAKVICSYVRAPLPPLPLLPLAAAEEDVMSITSSLHPASSPWTINCKLASLQATPSDTHLCPNLLTAAEDDVMALPRLGTGFNDMASDKQSAAA